MHSEQFFTKNKYELLSTETKDMRFETRDKMLTISKLQHFNLSINTVSLLTFCFSPASFVGIVLRDMNFYLKIIWPINMIIVGIASIGVFIETGRFKKILKDILFLLVLTLPLSLSFIKNSPILIQYISMK